MAREILKVRKVGGTLVVTLTQAVLEAVALEEGDRVLVEAIPPRRILISKEIADMSNTRRVELELAVLEAKHQSCSSQISAAVAEYQVGSSIDSQDLDCFVKQREADRDKAGVSIAEKRLELFDLQGEEPYAIRRWNLNEAEGRYAKTNIADAHIEVDLGLKRTSGDRDAVGRFRLNLDELASEGFVTRRTIDGGPVFDVQIYRESDGTYSLGVRQEHKTPLDGFAVR